MIIRISTEGQYSLEGPKLEELDRIDDKLLDAIAENDPDKFAKYFQAVLELVQSGNKIPDDELIESDLILPVPDTTLEEARDIFAKYPRKLNNLF